MTYDKDVFSTGQSSGFDPEVFKSASGKRVGPPYMPPIQGGEPSPVPDTPGVEQLRESIGMGLSDWGERAKQLLGAAKTGEMDYKSANEKARLDAPLRQTTTGMLGATVGQGLPLMALGSVGNGYKGAAAIGGLGGLSTPSLSPIDNLMNPLLGAALGTTVKAGVDLGGVLGKTAYNYFGQLSPRISEKIRGRLFNTISQDKNKEIIDALSAPKINVPGTSPNAGELASQTGAAPFSGFQELMKGRNSTAYEARDAANEAARKAYLAQNNPLPGTIPQAIKARSVQAKADYGAVADDLVSPDAAFKALEKKPSIQSVLSRASDIAQEYGRPFKVGDKYPVESLQYMKMAMDDLIKNPADFGIGATEANAIGSTQRDFIKWLSLKSPGWEAARLNYKNNSVPINQAEVTEQLLSKLNPRAGVESAAQFERAITDAPGTIKKATGQQRYDDLGQIYDSTQMGRVGGLLTDLQRKSEYTKLAHGPGGVEARGLIGDISTPITAPGLIDKTISIINAAMRRLESGATEKTLNQMAKDMLDPQYVARLMKATPLNQRPALELEIQTFRNAALGGVSGNQNPIPSLLGRRPEEQ